MPASNAQGPTSWLHVIPRDPRLAVPAGAPAAARAMLICLGLAVAADDGGLAPGPSFAARLLAGPQAPRGQRWRVPVPMAATARPPGAAARGVVRVEAGVLRVYPDPGPQGFQSEEPRRYRSACPGCGGALDLYRLAFPGADPLLGACPRCAAAVPIAEMRWDPPLAAARFEITFGDLDGRPSLGGDAVLPQLEAAVGCQLREVHVTL